MKLDSAHAVLNSGFMTPEMWLYRSADVTMRTIQRETDAGVEVLLVGSTGERAHHTFGSSDEAVRFREALQATIQQRGFTLAWATGR